MSKTVNINGIEYNTYACLCEAQTYNNAIINSKWDNLDEQDQARLLVMATRKIDSYSYAGEKVDKEQPLKFPRVMANGKVSDDNVLTDLCLQIANYYNSNGSSGSSADTSNLLSQLKEYKIGDLQVNFKDDAKIDLSGLDDFIEQALKDWLMSQSMEIWL